MEGQTMNRISQKIAPIWDKVHERHSHAQDDQIIYELYQRLKVHKLEVECVLGGTELSKGTMKSIETIAFCTDLKQCKAILSSYTSGDGDAGS